METGTCIVTVGECDRRTAVHKWDVFETALNGKRAGNPFTDYTIQAEFKGEHEQVILDGFYDGNGVYRVRFMPSFEGNYRYRVFGTFSTQAEEGEFEVVGPRAGNHGPMRVNGFHFAYEDGTRFLEMGTTCYAWTHQSDALMERTLNTLDEGYFNKMRFCVTPKHYLYNLHEPMSYPYEGTPCQIDAEQTQVAPNRWDFSRFNPAHFRRVEYGITQLAERGIEADMILLHPYDRWGFSSMTPEQDDLYIRYVVARFAAFRNVWWSLANEWDLFTGKTCLDWERIASLIVRHDPYHHLRSIHNCIDFYDYTRPWITHCSIQRQDLYKCAELVDQYRLRYGKPVVLDEIAYEGNIDQGWGNISGQELVRRFWEAALRGGYAGHGETFDRSDGILWWSHGGPLHGDSPARIGFLHKVLSETPGPGLQRMETSWDELAARPEGLLPREYYLYYYGFMRPCRRTYRMQLDKRYRVELIDTWNMAIDDVGLYSGLFQIEMPGREFMAVRIRQED